MISACMARGNAQLALSIYGTMCRVGPGSSNASADRQQPAWPPATLETVSAVVTAHIPAPVPSRACHQHRIMAMQVVCDDTQQTMHCRLYQNSTWHNSSQPDYPALQHVVLFCADHSSLRMLRLCSLLVVVPFAELGDV